MDMRGINHRKRNFASSQPFCLDTWSNGSFLASSGFGQTGPEKLTITLFMFFLGWILTFHNTHR